MAPAGWRWKRSDGCASSATSKRVLAGQHDLEAMVAEAQRARVAGRKFVRRVATEITVDNRSSEQYTVVDVFTQDRVGLLFAITHTLFKLGMVIHLARISTNADQALDVFYISDASGGKVVELDAMRRLRAALVERLDDVPRKTERRETQLSPGRARRGSPRAAMWIRTGTGSSSAISTACESNAGWATIRCRRTRAISASFSSTAATDQVEPAALKARTVSGYLEAMGGAGCRWRAQRRHLASIRGLAREMVEQKILERDPAAAVKLRPHPRALPRTLWPARHRDADRRDRYQRCFAASATARCSNWPTDAACGSRSWSA